MVPPVILGAKLMRQAYGIISRQQRLIHQLNLENDRLVLEKDAMELAYQRIGRDLIEQFLIALDTPENHDAIRERLVTGLGFYRDEIAVREEQVG